MVIVKESKITFANLAVASLSSSILSEAILKMFARFACGCIALASIFMRLSG